MKHYFTLGILTCAIGSASASQYFIDDGVMESAMGYAGADPFQLLWTNSFVIEEGCETITGIDVMLGVNASPIMNGRPITLFIGADANHDGILDQGGVLSQLYSTVMGANTSTFVTYDLTDVTFNVGDGFVVGAVWASTSTDRFVAGLDMTSPQYPGRSYAAYAFGGTIDPNDINAIGSQFFIENIGVNGNFMLRANCDVVPEPASVFALALGSLAVLRRRGKRAR